MNTTVPFTGFVGDRVSPETPHRGNTVTVFVTGANGKREPLAPRNDVRNHSPDGFNWGYGGSGPAQLALAICCYVVGVTRAQRIYQDFKFRVVAAWQDDQWELRLDDAKRIIELLESETADRPRSAL